MSSKTSKVSKADDDLLVAFSREWKRSTPKKAASIEAIVGHRVSLSPEFVWEDLEPHETDRFRLLVGQSAPDQPCRFGIMAMLNSMLATTGRSLVAHYAGVIERGNITHFTVRELAT